MPQIGHAPGRVAHDLRVHRAGPLGARRRRAGSDRLQRHAALRAGARAGRAHLGVHRAGVLAPCPVPGPVRARRIEVRSRVGGELLAAAADCRSSSHAGVRRTLPPFGAAGSTVMPQTGSRSIPAVVIRPARIEQHGSSASTPLMRVLPSGPPRRKGCQVECLRTSTPRPLRLGGPTSDGSYGSRRRALSQLSRRWSGAISMVAVSTW